MKKSINTKIDIMEIVCIGSLICCLGFFIMLILVPYDSLNMAVWTGALCVSFFTSFIISLGIIGARDDYPLEDAPKIGNYGADPRWGKDFTKAE